MERSNLVTSIAELRIISRSICEKSSNVKINRAFYQEQSTRFFKLVDLIEEIVVKQQSGFAEESLHIAATELLQSTRSVNQKADQVFKKRNGVLGYIKAYLIEWWRSKEVREDLETAAKRVTTLRNQLLLSTLGIVMARIDVLILSLEGDHDTAAKLMGLPEMTADEIKVALKQASNGLNGEGVAQAERNYFQVKINLLKSELSIAQATAVPTPPASPNWETKTQYISKPTFDFDMERNEPDLQEYDPISRPGSGNANNPAPESETAILDTIRICHRLRENTAAIQPFALVGSLCDLASALSALQWQDEGLAICHWITRLAHSTLEKPDIAASLNKLSSCLSRFGQHNEGLRVIQDAVVSYHELAESQGEKFQPHLARALNNLSFRLSGVGQYNDSLEAIQRAVDLYRKLNLQSELAMSLHNLSSRLDHLNRPEDALRVDEEAVQIYRNLANDHPVKFQPIYAKSLNNLSFLLSNAGRREEALKAIEEAVKQYRALAGDTLPGFSPNLAICLNNLSVHLSGFDRHDEELQAIEEAVDISRRLRDLHPIKFKPLLARSLWHLVTGLTHSGHTESYLDAMEEAMQLENTISDVGAGW